MVNIANMDLLSKISLEHIKMIWFAGEVFPTKQFNYWKGQLIDVVFVNLYGPIEITLDCIYYIIDREFRDDEPLPLGVPCNNTDIILLNSDNKRCDINEEGEICVRGTSLAMGYYNDHEKTSEVFIQNPLNKSYPELIYRTGDIAFINSKNQIMFVGRRDSLIKHQGYRIELREIEYEAVNHLGVVANCCAVYHAENKEIVLYYEENGYVEMDIRESLGKVLPKYMVPSVYKRLDILPRNTNGKIDRLILSKMMKEI
jgi:acyl-coenzyme A synthetase/AMP-(fatty) acid ligase